MQAESEHRKGFVAVLDIMVPKIYLAKHIIISLLPNRRYQRVGELKMANIFWMWANSRIGVPGNPEDNRSLEYCRRCRVSGGWCGNKEILKRGRDESLKAGMTAYQFRNKLSGGQKQSQLAIAARVLRPSVGIFR